MAGRRTLIVLMALCGLAFSAIAAQSAAATDGTTAFTCSNAASKKDFATEHCVPGEAGTSFGHKDIPVGEVTDAKGSNAKTDATTSKPTNMTFHWTIMGAKVSITATNVKGVASLQNSFRPNGEHFVEAATAPVEFSGVTAGNPNCAVEGLPSGELGLIKSQALRASTLGQGMGVKFVPDVGELLTEFRIVKSGMAACPEAGTYPIVGSFIGVPNGATIKFTAAETTNSKGLHIGNGFGPVAGLDGLITVTAKKKDGEDELTQPIAPTTVGTP